MCNEPQEAEGNSGQSWYRDKNFWLTFAPVLFGNERWCLAPKEAESVISLLSLNKGSRVLDACCGVGRHAVEFAARGMAVTGVDQMEEYLEAARETAEAERAEVEFLQADLRLFHREEYFDAAVSMFISVGYFEDEKDEITVFSNICGSLKPGGVFLVDTIGKEILRQQFKARDVYRGDGIFVISTYRVENNFSRLWNRWVFYDEGGRHEYTFSHRVFSSTELEALLLAGGFSSVRVYGDLDGAPYSPEADRLIAVAVK